MPVPHKVVEEYIFDVPGLGTVKGRIVEPMIPFTSPLFWQTSHSGNTHVMNSGGDIDIVRELLFQYVDTLDSSSKPNSYY
ncbi:hypothetical protein QLG07_12875 [Erwinia sp. V90_4]|uniref:hypothetical protein n=1 Tax=Erwinia sp. V90_4 TaxID=3044239 RepID=UPI00249E3C26|nr:hypothetical protein [Erwinia sp. V90_4]MDI3440355.1 hypothetical protein [Erwinia sp. V90_4]